MSRMCWRKLKEFYYRHHKPKHLIPSASPLSPCTIEPYTWIDGKYEENKGYIPVSLLLKAIDNDDMLNIAVAGNYGVGKSSVINTAEKRQRKWFFPKHRFIKISLASLLTLENKQRKKEENKQIHQKKSLLKMEELRRRNFPLILESRINRLNIVSFNKFCIMTVLKRHRKAEYNESTGPEDISHIWLRSYASLYLPRCCY